MVEVRVGESRKSRRHILLEAGQADPTLSEIQYQKHKRVVGRLSSCQVLQVFKGAFWDRAPGSQFPVRPRVSDSG